MPTVAHRPHWSAVLQALREARGVTQEGWAARLGVSLRTIQRWEHGHRVPDPSAEAGILAYCSERGLFRPHDAGPLAGLSLTAESLQTLLAEARLSGSRQAAAGSRATPQSSVLSPQHSNLPALTSSFVGREQELAAVRRLLGGTRLLTLAGIGGGGKTRLALAVARELLWAYPHGVCFVELAALTDPALVPQTVGAALSLHPTGQQSIVDVLREHLAPRHLLLILDNCEHLLPACATLVETLLRACPDLEVMLTSREPLGVPGEMVWRVPPLSPADATCLFAERARLYQPDLELTAANKAAVEEVCERLDGIPLAIELAAARVRTLSVEQIAARLSDRFRLLTGGSRTALPRHQTLRATLDWSHDLLTEEEQVLLRRLAVFAGGWSLETAEAVCADGGGAGHDTDTLDLLTSLVDKSLVTAEAQDGAVRYQLLETVRQYVGEKLDAAGETTATRGRHRTWYLALAEQAEPALLGPEQAAWLARLEEEHDNLRGALAWSLTGVPGRSPVRRGLGNRPGSPIPDGDAALRLAGALARFWERRDHISEGRRWLAQALEAGEGAPAEARVKVLRGEGWLAYLQGDCASARNRHQEILLLYRGLGDRRRTAEVQSTLGRIAFRQGDHAGARAFVDASLPLHVELGHTPGIAGDHGTLGLLALREGDHTAARAFFEVGLTLQRELGNTEGIADALEDLATVAGEQGEYEEQIALLEESLALFYQLGNKGGIALVLGNLGMGAWLQGNAGRAMALLRESLSLYREVGDRRGVARLLGNQSFVALSQRDYARAVTLCRESLALYRESGDAWGIGRYLPVLAGALFAQGESKHAARLFGAAAVLREWLGTPLPPVVRPAHDRTVAAIRATLGEPAFDAAWTAGWSMSLESAVTCALADAETVAGP